MATGLEDWKNGLRGQPSLIEWCKATAKRNLQSLEERQGPGGAPLVPLAPRTVKGKGNDRPGFGKTGKMAAALTAPNNFSVSGDLEAEVYAGQGDTIYPKLTTFLRGRDPGRIEKRSLRKNKTKPNTEKRWFVMVSRQPARDFIGHDEKVLEAHGEALLADVAKQLGFVER